MRFLMFVGLTIGGAVGWWLGSYVGILTALIASTVGSLAAVWVIYRLTRDYM